LKLAPPRGIGDAEVEILAQAIETGQCGEGLTSLLLSGAVSSRSSYDYEFVELPLSRIGDTGAGRLATALATGRCCNLKALLLDGHGIGAAGLGQLVGALSNGGIRLNQLVLSDDRRIGAEGIGAESVGVLADALAAGWDLGALELDSTGIDDDGAARPAIALVGGHCVLRRLEISRNKIGPVGTGALADALKSEVCCLQGLGLGGGGYWPGLHRQIGDGGASKLAAALASGTCVLTKLSLDDNGISDAGTCVLAEALAAGGLHLTELNLANNQIGDDGAARLAQWVKQ
jgi:hypothetical protein